MNCLTFDFQFYSEEFPEFVGGTVNDAFIAELDTSTWTTSASAIALPDNFAFDPNGDPISINATGATTMSAASAAGTTYDGATPLLSASRQVSPGPHSLFLSIFDQGDNILDSATLIDRLHARFTPSRTSSASAAPQRPSRHRPRPPPPPPPPRRLATRRPRADRGPPGGRRPAGQGQVRCPGEGGFRDLSATEVIAIGCTLDATNGRVTLTSSYNGTPETVTFYDGLFKLKQKEGAKPFLIADLRESSAARAGHRRRRPATSESSRSEEEEAAPLGRRRRPLHHQRRRGRSERPGRSGSRLTAATVRPSSASARARW